MQQQRKLWLGRCGQDFRIWLCHTGFWPMWMEQQRKSSLKANSIEMEATNRGFHHRKEDKLFCGTDVQICLSPTKCSSWKAVNQASGMAAAWINVMSLGTGIRRPSGTVTYSAWPPPETRAITASPIFHWPLQPVPSSATVPAASTPKISLAPLGGGYFPLL